jgi:tetratricopeptide (TPR) repeat protein/O-antigen ligase
VEVARLRVPAISFALAWSAILGAAVFLLVMGGGYPGLASLNAKVITQIIAFGLLGTWLVGCVFRASWRPSSVFVLPMGLVVSAYVLSTLTSERPRQSLEPTLGGLGLAHTIVFMTRLFAPPYFRRRLATFVLTLTCFVAVMYVIQVVLAWSTWWIDIGWVAAFPLRPMWAGLTYGTPTLVATLLLMLGPLAAAIAFNRYGRWPAVAVLAGAMLAVFLTGARSGYLAAAAAGLTALVLLAASRGTTWASVSSSVRQRPDLVIGIFVPASILVLFFLPSIYYRFQQGGDALRLDLWRSAVSIFADHPLTGAGPGTWVQLKVLANAEETPNHIFANAHNLYVQTIAEVGVIGVAALLMLVIVVGRRFASIHRTGDPSVRVETIAVLAGLVAFGFQAIFDTLVNVPMVGVLLCGLVAWVDSAAMPAPTRLTSRVLAGNRLGQTATVLALAAVVGSVPVLIRIDIAWASSLAGNAAAENRDWTTAILHYDEAHRLDADFTLYQLQQASALSRLGRDAEARAVLDRAVRVDPVAVNQIGLARLEMLEGKTTAALERARQALRLGHGESVVALNAGVIAETVGDHAFALESYTAAIAWNPGLAGSAFWRDTGRAGLKQAAVEAALPLLPPLDAAVVLAYAGDTTRATTMLLAEPISRERELRLAIVEWRAGRTVEAIARLEAMLRSDPLDWEAAGWASRISRLSGDITAANRFARWAYTVQGDAAPAAVFEVSRIPPEANEVAAGLPRSYPAGVYQRPTSPYLLIDGLVLIGAQ